MYTQVSNLCYHVQLYVPLEPGSKGGKRVYHTDALYWTWRVPIKDWSDLASWLWKKSAVALEGHCSKSFGYQFGGTRRNLIKRDKQQW